MSSSPPKTRNTRTVEYDKDELWVRFWYGVGVGLLLAAPTACWFGNWLAHLFP